MNAQHDISEADFISMNESMIFNMDLFVNDHYKYIANEDFEETIKSSIYELFTNELTSYLSSKNKLCSMCDEYCIREYFDFVFSYVEMSFYQKIIPKRSFTTTFIRNIPNVENMKIKILNVKNKYQPEQRSSEWYQYRYNLITASNAWKCFENNNVRNQLIYEKCKPLVTGGGFNYVNTSSPMHHGVKYEDVSVKLYEEKYKTKIADFGCLKHDKYPFLGASPDGINVLETSPLYGRMLEIKNPVSRIITGNPKKDYWIQMQLQMEVCDLNECDFLETKIVEFNNEEEFIVNGGFNQQNDNFDNAMGILLYYSIAGKPAYELAPFFCNEHDYNIWFEKTQLKYEEDKNATFVRSIHWKVDVFSCVLVLRNKLWFRKSIDEIKDIWDIIEYDRLNGFEQRAPKKRSRSIDNTSASGIEIKTDNDPCLIELDAFQNVLDIEDKFNLDDLELDFDTSGVEVDLNLDLSGCIL
jgi:putative phage-type endonuclease